MSREAMKLALEALEPRPGMPNPEYESLTQCAITALREALAEQPASKPWVRLTDDDKCVKELYESDTDPEWIDGYTAGLKDAENKLRRYNAQPALVVEQLNPVAEVKLKQQGGNAGFATVINEIYDPMREPLRVGDKLYTSLPAQQAPAGSVYRYGKDSSGKQWHGIKWTASGLDLPDGTLIYTSPPAQRKPLTDEQIDNTTRKQVDDLLDHIYEYGTAAEGIDFRVRAIARAIEAAHGITEEGGAA